MRVVLLSGTRQSVRSIATKLHANVIVTASMARCCAFPTGIAVISTIDPKNRMRVVLVAAMMRSCVLSESITIAADIPARNSPPHNISAVSCTCTFGMSPNRAMPCVIERPYSASNATPAIMSMGFMCSL